jgi:hypothetical protein
MVAFVRRLCHVILSGALCLALVLVLAASASAAGTPVQVGSPLSEEPPAIAVEGAGNAVVAWANTKDVAGAKNFVQSCVIPLGASACSHSGNLIPANGAEYIDRVAVLADGSTLVVLADVFGGAGEGYVPEQEWQSTDGGATWTSPNGGQSIADGILNADTQPLGAVIAPGTGVLGYGWDTAGGSPPSFNVFPLASPSTCSRESCPAGFATLEPATNPDQLGNEEGQFASIAQGPDAGVMGVFETLFTNGPLGCTESFGTAYTYGAGNQSASNNYNISPGQPNSAWKVPLTQADCDTEYPAVGGGPSGFGILESNLASHSTIYHAFDTATEKFDTAPVTVADEGELDPSLSQDGAGGIYATFLGGPGGPVRLAYSADGGKTWGTGTLDAGNADKVTSSVNSSGQGWVAWTNNGSVFAQPFAASDVSAAAVSESATASSTTVTVTITCAGPCTVTITITIPASSAAVKGKHGGNVTLASGTFTLHGKGSHRLTLHLTKAGRRALARHHRHLTALLSLSQKTASGTAHSTRTLKIKP